MMKTFDDIIDNETKKPYFMKMMAFLSERGQHTTIFPDKSLWFLSLKLTKLSDIKVVILGQDPYHDYGQAHGLAFSVSNGRLPKSLINIFKELKADVHIDRTEGNLSDWANQGVLLLNTILTVEAHKPLAHQLLGWERFTLEIIKNLNLQERPIVFILWGNNAIKYSEYLNNTRHLVIKSAHPSPLSAYRGFFGSKVFSKTNQYLIEHQINPIKW